MIPVPGSRPVHPPPDILEMPNARASLSRCAGELHSAAVVSEPVGQGARARLRSEGESRSVSSFLSTRILDELRARSGLAADAGRRSAAHSGRCGAGAVGSARHGRDVAGQASHRGVESVQADADLFSDRRAVGDADRRAGGDPRVPHRALHRRQDLDQRGSVDAGVSALRRTRDPARPPSRATVVQAGQPLFFIEATDMVQAQNDFLAALALHQQGERARHADRDRRQAEPQAAREQGGLAARLPDRGSRCRPGASELRVAETALEAARNRLRILGKTEREISAFQDQGTISPETPIYAPITGTVVQRKIGPGQYVSYTSTGAVDPVFTIGDLSTVWVVAYVRESEASKVRVGQQMEFRVLAYPNSAFKATIDYVAASLDPSDPPPDGARHDRQRQRSRSSRRCSPRHDLYRRGQRRSGRGAARCRDLSRPTPRGSGSCAPTARSSCARSRPGWSAGRPSRCWKAWSPAKASSPRAASSSTGRPDG